MGGSNNLKAWISAARLRTLPLSISGILVGSAYAYLYRPNFLIGIGGIDQLYFDLDILPAYNFWIPVLALLTTLGFQVLSNFANDYGDGVKGTDNEERIGPMRAIQSGLITPSQMKKAMIITGILTFISAIVLIYLSLGIDRLLISLLFLLLGIAAIWAAIKYTVGDNAYGYRGLGDVFVFIFFGPVSVMGIFYLINQFLKWELILPSMCVGLLSVAVLNLNNMRDMESDQKAGKNTIVVKLGLERSKMLHLTVIFTAFVSAFGFLAICFFRITEWSNAWSAAVVFIPLLAFLPLFLHAKRVSQNSVPALLDPELKKVALSTFLFSILSILSVFLIV